MRWCWLLVLAACGGRKSEPSTQGSASADPPPPEPRPAKWECKREKFAEKTTLPEASGAAWMQIDGKLALVVIADSGNEGRYAIIDPDTGETREEGGLPLGGDGDDLEGVAVRGGKLVAVTSPGWIRTWKRVEGGFDLVDAPYALGPVDLQDRGPLAGGKPPEGNGMVCAARATNCGRNYEGLCLAPDSQTTRPVGFVASKADGHLYPLVERDGKYAVERAGAIKVAAPNVLADCAFDGEALYAGGNVFDPRVWRINGWKDPGTATVETIGPLGLVNPETLAARGEIIYRMSDSSSDSSLLVKYRCRAP